MSEDQPERHDEQLFKEGYYQSKDQLMKAMVCPFSKDLDEVPQEFLTGLLEKDPAAQLGAMTALVDVINQLIYQKRIAHGCCEHCKQRYVDTSTKQVTDKIRKRMENWYDMLPEKEKLVLHPRMKIFAELVNP